MQHGSPDNEFQRGCVIQPNSTQFLFLKRVTRLINRMVKCIQYLFSFKLFLKCSLASCVSKSCHCKTYPNLKSGDPQSTVQMFLPEVKNLFRVGWEIGMFFQSFQVVLCNCVPYSTSRGGGRRKTIFLPECSCGAVKNHIEESRD
ncbi:hypothetical protein BSKO_04333 [Bryopsis sp. KO-2023]|nr:hypothetical protein BSKO_04333 [Bryopsis sp. KO-2023]